ncbi:benzoate/H(+) symporter BenE family transporter [Pseudomonas sp. H3(2019)]|uniref:benzoate/H(+) symporter BenE family transporter n=1 Tax=Pseudomonas sp. H3(2019) TaxID=2598724 RepID=UPI001191C614|nr:benzoate/H(+) symporter BenE family transporter [Pseudomonas sp. H3(2019)]TVT80125.1 hypothetical protein FPT12_23730 [Pseudomonas sp. H3(2019)]
MSSSASPTALRLGDLIHPIVAGLISVIVNYGGTFILVFQAAKVAGLSPELTASWVWSVSIGVGITGLFLSWVSREPIITEDPSKRWIAGVAAGVFYILVGIFGVTLAAVFMALPATFITTLAGLALLGTIGASLASAMADVKSREASLITFLASAANITLLGIGGAFWGLLIGLAAYALLNGRLPRREAVVIPAADDVVTAKGATH